jgi:transposase-like protein
MAKPIPKDLKDERLTKIKVEGLSGAEAARRYGVNVKNIYRWVADGVGGPSSQTLELNRVWLGRGEYGTRSPMREIGGLDAG